MSTLSFKLVAFSPDLFYAWRSEFEGISSVEVLEGDILRERADAIVSPANSFGYMDGGLDLKYSQHFGWELERSLRTVLEEQFYGEIPVGAAVVVPTGSSEIRYLVSAPTMRVPSDVSDSVNAYLAFKAVIQSVFLFNATNEGKIANVLCPGLGTGEGRLSAKACARQMRAAYNVCVRGEFVKTGGLAGAVTQHMELLDVQ